MECAKELLEYPNLKGVFGTNSGSTVGFARAVKEQERKDLALVGFDYSEEIAELIDFLCAKLNSSLDNVA